MAEIYVSTDIEADGPIPGRYSLLSFASAAFDTGRLTPGDYVFRVLAADVFGNEARENRDLPITVVAP